MDDKVLEGSAAATMEASRDDSVILREAKQKLKLQRLKKEAKALERKVQQQASVIEEASWKRQREKNTMHLYFASSRNPDNRSDLRQLQGCANVGETSCKDQPRHAFTSRLTASHAGATVDTSRLTTLDDDKVETNVVVRLLNLVKSVPLDTEVCGTHEVEVDLSILVIIPLSSDSSAFVFSEDDPTFADRPDHFHSPLDLDFSAHEMSDFDLEAFDVEPTLK
jgi:hypothetical protein